MKKTFSILSMALLLFGCGKTQVEPEQAALQPDTTTTTTSKKILIAYYSKTGNTAVMANQIQTLTGGDLFEITTDHQYPEEYKPTTVQAKEEIANGFKPVLNKKVDNFADYDIIFIGSPCWWSTVAPAVASFLSDYDYSGKTVVPFMTHGGGGFGSTISDIHKLVPTATMLEGKIILGNAINDAYNEVESWLKTIAIIE